MPKQQIRTAKIAAPSGHFSQAVVIEAKGRLVFVSGMTARRPDGKLAGIGDVEEQTRQVCENIRNAARRPPPPWSRCRSSPRPSSWWKSRLLP